MTTARPEPATRLKTLAERLASYTEGLQYEQLPHATVREAKRRVIDALGCALGAFDSDPAMIAREVSRNITVPNGATVLGTGRRTSPDWAAFANGTHIRYLDYNDTYLSKEPAHPSDNIAAVLAVSEALGRSGREALTAIVLAYEIQCRLCDAASIRSRGWDHVTYGAFSTALAAGKLYGLNRAGLVHVQGLAGTPNNALRQTRVGELSHWKGCAFANAARNGVFAAMLADAGMTGPSEIFEGEMGFWKQVSGPFEIAPMAGEALDGALHDDFMISKTYIKHFPAEYHSQSAIEAALALRSQIGSVDEIEAIVIESFDAAVDIIAGYAEHWRPKSRETADHSMPYCVSAALMDGRITLDSFTPERIGDPSLLALIQKVTVNRNAEMTAGYPDGIPNALTLRLKDGRTLSKTVTYPLGHAKNPMSDGEVEHKFRTLAERVFSATYVNRLLETLWTLDVADDLSEVMALFAWETLG